MTTHEVREAIRRWAKEFMHRSMTETRRFLEEYNLSFPQMSVLMWIYRGGGCRVSDLGAQMGVTNAAASQLVERLVQAGLVRRASDPTDRRVRRLELTPEGLALVERAIAAREAWIERALERLSPAQRRQVAEALDVLTQAIQAEAADISEEE